MYYGLKFTGVLIGLISIIGGIILILGFSTTEVHLYTYTKTVTNYFAIFGGVASIGYGLLIMLGSMALGDAATYSKQNCEDYYELKKTVDKLSKQINKLTGDVEEEKEEKEKIKDGKICIFCGHKNNKEATFCKSCGRYLVTNSGELQKQKEKRCKNCSCINNIEADFCKECGTFIGKENFELVDKS